MVDFIDPVARSGTTATIFRRHVCGCRSLRSVTCIYYRESCRKWKIYNSKGELGCLQDKETDFGASQSFIPLMEIMCLGLRLNGINVSELQ